MYFGERKVENPIRWGMVGGGKGSSIGYIHRSAALRDNNFKLVAGAFDIDPERGKEFGAELHVAADRCYPDYKTMFAEETKRDDGVQAISIATPNNTHFEISKAALEHGLHVYCEKPLCFTTEEAEELLVLSKKQNRIFGVSYGYAGYQMIMQGREMIKNGDLGDIRLVRMAFAHGGNTQESADKLASQKWRTDPKFAGPSFVLGDLGTHPLYLAEMMIPDFGIKDLMCSKQAFIKTREPLEDNAYVLMNLTNGGFADMWCSAVDCGSVHGLRIRIVGTKASISWWAEHPNQLTYEPFGEPIRILERGTGYLYPEAKEDDRIGGGHGEGLFESWSNLYYRFAQAIAANEAGEENVYEKIWLPNIEDGVFGVKWVEKCVESADKGSVWVDFD
ncbi:MAG TPA: Gfo/Idh/MocA family oxidoreductase [Clostridiaceae bacterium]|nr:Gfo/Idh/MocA family oxidoreductase [Clostridiaceae bacterium]